MKVLVVMATGRVAETQGRGLALCLCPGIWTTSEQARVAQGLTGMPLLHGAHQSCLNNGNLTPHGGTCSPGLPGGPIILHLLPPTTPAPQPRRPPQGTLCPSLSPAACSAGQPRGAVEPGRSSRVGPGSGPRVPLPSQLFLTSSMCVHDKASVPGPQSAHL